MLRRTPQMPVASESRRREDPSSSLPGPGRGAPAARARRRAADCGATAYDCALLHVGRREFADAIRHLERLLAAAPARPEGAQPARHRAHRRRQAGRGQRRGSARPSPSTPPSPRRGRTSPSTNSTRAATRPRAGTSSRLLKPRPPTRSRTCTSARSTTGRSASARRSRTTRRAAPAYAQTPAGHAALRPCPARGGAGEGGGRRPRPAPGRGRRRALFEAGVALGQAGAHAEAARFFAAARASYQDPYAAGYNQALMLVEAGDHDGAIRVVAGARSRTGRAPAELYNLVSRAYVGAGPHPGGLRRAAPGHAPRARGARELRRPRHALRRARELRPRARDRGHRPRPACRIPGSLHLQRGVLLAMKGRLAEAEKEFETARAARPGPARPLRRAGHGLDAERPDGQGGRGPARGAAAPQGPRGALHLRGGPAALGGRGGDAGGAEAVAALRASIRANPRFAPARAELGRLLLKRDEVDLAIRELEKAAALDPSSTPALYALSQAYRKKGDRAARAGAAGARQQAQRPGARGRPRRRAAARRGPHREGGHRAPAEASRRASDGAPRWHAWRGPRVGSGSPWAGAPRRLRRPRPPGRRAGQPRPRHRPAPERRRGGGARRAARGGGREPGDAVAHDYLGIALGESGLAEAAAAAFREAIRLDPRRAEAHFHLGVVLDRLGRARRPSPPTSRRCGSSPSRSRRATASAWSARRSATSTARSGCSARSRSARPAWPTRATTSGSTSGTATGRRGGCASPPTSRRPSASCGRPSSSIPRSPTRASSSASSSRSGSGWTRRSCSSARRRAGARLRLRVRPRPRAPAPGRPRRRRGAVPRRPRRQPEPRPGAPCAGPRPPPEGRPRGGRRGAAASVAERPRDAQAHNVLGTVLLKLDDVNGAIEAFRAATRLDPALTEARVNLAQALVKAGRKDEARAARPRSSDSRRRRPRCRAR